MPLVELVCASRTNQPAMSFDTLAPYYRGMEFVTAGGLLQRCRTSFLGETKSCRRALLLGEGPGRFLVELLHTNPRVEVTCVERSARMIEAARAALDRRGLDHSRVRFENGDVLTWQPLTSSLSPADGDRAVEGLERSILEPCEKFDLIGTHFFLDCFRQDELASLVKKIARRAAPQAKWLLADFRVPPSGWRRWRARAVLALLYAFFRAVTGLSASRLTPADEFLKAAGFRLAGRRLANFGLVHADLWVRDEQ
jgi:SAM-dependent methyltransferase